MSIFPAVLQRQSPTQHMNFATKRSIFPSFDPSKKHDIQPSLLTPKPENDINTIEELRKAQSKPVTKLNQMLERELSPIRNVEEHQADPANNVSIDKKNYCNRKFPIFCDPKDEVSARRRKSAIFRL